MKAINDYVIVDIVKEEPKKVSGLILTDETDETNRYKKATIVSVSYTHLTLPTTPYE